VADPLHTPIDVAGAAQPGRVVTVEGGAARLAAGPLPLRSGPGRWGAYVSAPDTEADLGRAQEAVARALAAGACLVAVGDGTPLTRRLVCEAARLDHGAVTLLVEDGSEDSVFEDRARTAVLSGRTDLIGRRP
jgi:anthraniloyl-CoA monooxygenase